MIKIKRKLMRGDCLERMNEIEDGTVDAAIFSPPYPGIKRAYGTWESDEWLRWMRKVMKELRRVVSAQGSAVVIIGPNSEKMGKMRTWPYRFALDMAKTWGIVQDSYWIKPVVLPTAHATQYGLMRTAVEWCLWLGHPECYRNQKKVLWDYSETQLALVSKRAHLTDEIQYMPHGGQRRLKRMAKNHGGSTPMNFFPCLPKGYRKHPACFPIKLIEFWIKYICPPKGTVLDPMMGSGTTGVAARQLKRSFIGIEMDKGYYRIARDRIRGAV